ncbi:MAG TPA: carboxypeptidase-like regulatory domain-containing protein, partial [Candidatus Acidoferrum sp.]|nr:carboxypeptidase-like regulatory domain-containing protein [Candidatus Acidoferrum sp.]
MAAITGPAYAATPATGQLVSQATSKTTGAILGAIKDEEGAPVSGATITVRGVVTQHATSDAKGTFTFNNLPAGVYLIVAERAGFQTAQQSDFAIFSGEVE